MKLILLGVLILAFAYVTTIGGKRGRHEEDGRD